MSPLSVAFRVDASEAIGTGHVFRSLSLATELRRQGASCTFICRLLPGNLCDLIEKNGFKVSRLSSPARFHSGVSRIPHSHWLGVAEANEISESTAALASLPASPDWIVVDHYGIDKIWESPMRQIAGKILVIDDLDDRAHDCDILVDQNFRRDPDDRYVKNTPSGCLRLLGPNYALLREEFRTAPPESDGKKAVTPSRILVFFGGSDPTGATLKAIHALKQLPSEKVHFKVVAGAANPAKAEIEATCRLASNFTFSKSVTNVAELMRESDFFVGSGGSITWERFRMKLPGVVIAVAENQIGISKEVEAAGLSEYLGDWRSFPEGSIREKIRSFIVNPFPWVAMADRAAALVDGNGTERVVAKMFSEKTPGRKS